MSAEDPRMTPEQAQAQLAQSRKPLTSARDRMIHATGTAVGGLTFGLFAATRNITPGTESIVVPTVVVAFLLALAIWVARAARTVPRRARLWSRLGVASSLAVAVVLVLPWLNLQAQAQPNTWPMALVGALVVAAPSLVAAAVVAGSRT